MLYFYDFSIIVVARFEELTSGVLDILSIEHIEE
jgi:hypothetical protein